MSVVQGMGLDEPGPLGCAALVQGSAEWHCARLGCVTASRIADVVARTRSGYGAARQAYMTQLLAERLTLLPTETFQTAAMRWGSELEPHAVQAYEDATGTVTMPVGFLQHPAITFAGASPDRLIGADGLLEVKCPNTTTHLEALLSGTVSERHFLQVQWQLACSGRTWCDLVSYDPRLPEAYACSITRIGRDAAKVAELEGEVQTFLAELEAKLEALELASLDPVRGAMAQQSAQCVTG